MRRLWFLVLAASALLAACGGKEEAGDGWRRVLPGTMTAAQQRQQIRALDAKDTLFATLSGRLKKAVAQAGAAGALDVCEKAAPEAAAQVASEKGVRIGRTSFKLRNRRNQPPDWVRPFVAERTAETVYLAGADGCLAALYPIRTRLLCLRCHGPDDEVEAAVKERLGELYPGDRATGFHAGDLRGWLWVEVPPTE